ncbi:hypothetical protein T484DRAFT_3649635, partial [Baffinella frigidus]
MARDKVECARRNGLIFSDGSSRPEDVFRSGSSWWKEGVLCSVAGDEAQEGMRELRAARGLLRSGVCASPSESDRWRSRASRRIAALLRTVPDAAVRSFFAVASSFDEGGRSGLEDAFRSGSAAVRCRSGVCASPSEAARSSSRASRRIATLRRIADAAARSFFAAAAATVARVFDERAGPRLPPGPRLSPADGLLERESMLRRRSLRIRCGAMGIMWKPGCAGRWSTSSSQSTSDWTELSFSTCASSRPGWSTSRGSARRLATRLSRRTANLGASWATCRASSWPGWNTSCRGNVEGASSAELDSRSDGGTVLPEGEKGPCHTSLSALGCGLRSPSAASSCRASPVVIPVLA